MRMVPVSWRTLAVGAALALTVTPAFASAAPAAPTAPDKDAVSPIEKLRQSLDKPITIKLEGTLAAAVNKIKSQANVKIVLDSQTITQQLGFAPEQAPLTGALELKDVKVRTVLQTVLSPFALDYVPIGDTLIITTEPMAMMRQMRQRISVDMDKVEFAGALKQIARDTAANLILDPRVEKQSQAKVTLRLEDVPLETAVRLLAEMAGLKPVRVGNTLFITSKETAAEMRQDPDIAQPQGSPAELQLQQQQLQQLQLQFGQQQGGLAGPPGAVVPAPIVPPNVPPAVPPAVERLEDKPAPDAKPADDKPKDPKDAPPADPKPLTK